MFERFIKPVSRAVFVVFGLHSQRVLGHVSMYFTGSHHLNSIFFEQALLRSISYMINLVI
ncbi:hypothetical protein JL49_24990 [Pseudoalteromonas luteoviolacea]|uniref:Uncharacterized protein n=1 Tax=Pseudoalteromonas luteoviolacea NCIMB 1942 TaxID=1365253 RepID=A0A166Z821_9GAMM|nr:hypothetical protein N482_17970 [Pseudoalteromonas luteoviolacea NCIMB 1942]KZW98167.1 hypothetical protein JL49_24990 [Pseudoalteromonas luteoviolacea]